ncbi:MAG: carboxylesterase/lipase family protein [Devosia sp.]|uniref:carboxylesterase/lipase family protein n=1 Tax=Devosia sp. TaxID=1871048 RepID=UPI0024CBE864|nr:carboxylesterase family protein [Devosia sp.]UYN98554.1 MAG: carboxylesterase/lipase family protein [Devosia sp.]
MSAPFVIEIASRRARYRGLRDATGDRFTGIQYARPPVGALRFRPPEPIDHQDIVDATTFGKAPPQARRAMPDWAPRGAGFETGEDCLNLNLYTPAADDARRPVIVHAFGGGFQGGSAHGSFHNEAGFAHRSGVVLVRPNMRVGALGFLSLGDRFGEERSAANRGMLDLIAALEWVRDNIAAFGGDPDNVTLAGMSSGAFTISALFGVDGVAELYRRVWLMSGPASRIISEDTASALADDFLDRCGVGRGDGAALEQLPVETIISVQDQVLATHLGERNAPGGRTFGIVLDGVSLARHPIDGLASGRFKAHGLVAGWARDEARMWYAFGMMPEVTSRASLVGSIARFLPDTAEAALDGLMQEQPGLTLTQYEEIFLSRAIYREPAIRTAQTHAAAGGSAWTYEFGWVPGFEGGRLGAAHGFDEPFVFGDLSNIPLAKGDAHAGALAQAMSEALIGFARTGVCDWPKAGPGESVPRYFA